MMTSVREMTVGVILVMKIQKTFLHSKPVGTGTAFVWAFAAIAAVQSPQRVAIKEHGPYLLVKCLPLSRKEEHKNNKLNRAPNGLRLSFLRGRKKHWRS
mmetsp:Transcript_135646/g.306911  ORF Transcript_135646/g.306911 Transcript_135646/m.306911 type:complete len:99 (+) Transcript_135646:268-564(+)